MFTGLTISGSSLRLLDVGKRGVVASFSDSDAATIRALKSMGLRPGTSITLEQRSPRFVVRTQSGTVALNSKMIKALHVRPRNYV